MTTPDPTNSPYEPVGLDEWQDAVDAAHASLALESARRYGLVTGGPTVRVDRCVDIIERGRVLGVTPRPDAIERFTDSLRQA